MKISNKSVKTIKLRNRKGYAAICGDCLTEGKTQQEAIDRMVKAINRVEKKMKSKLKRK